MKKYSKTQIRKMAKKVAKIKKPVSNLCANKYNEEYEFLKNVEYLPSPFDVADYYGINCEFKNVKGEMPSYLNRKEKTIFISNRYTKDNPEAKMLCAHELGHYFCQEDDLSAMNNDFLNRDLEKEIEKEYEANIFAILLMPQILSGHPWETYVPKKLNRLVYERIINKSG